MKRIILFALLTIGVFSSCQKKTGEDLTTTPTDPTNPTTPTNPSAATLSVSRLAIAAGTFSGYTDTFTIQSSIDWSITLSSGLSAWLTLDTVKGKSGNTVVKLSVTSNATTTQTGTITVSPVGNTNALPQVITLKQEMHSLLWQKAFGTASSTGFNEVIQDADGGYVFAGAHANNGWVYKTDANGNKIWEYSTTGIDKFNSITIAPDGGYVVVGNRANLDPTYGYLHDYDILVVKLNASGAKIWEKVFGSTGSETGGKVLPAADGGFMISTSTNSTNGDVSTTHGLYDLCLLKIDNNGNKVWSKSYGGSKDEFSETLAVTSDGGYWLTGMTMSTDGDVSGNYGDWDVLVLKLDASGNKIWSKTFGGSQQEEPSSIIATKDGGCIIASSTYSNDGDVNGNHSSESDIWLLKLDINGQKTWQAALGGTDIEQACSVVTLSDGSYMVAGRTYSNNGDVTGNHGNQDYWVVKVSSAGKKLWQKTFGGPGVDVSTSLIVATDGSFVIAGNSFANGGDVTGISGTGKGWVVKFK